nr:T9SS type A sorting domain-containing protein [Bacteroidota bacterium]
IHHFTAENGPLPSNTITSLAIDERNGEVFIGTDRGIISYRSDATGPSNEAECASVFPNPVRSSHTGPIAVTGLPRDSEMKITDVSGNLVYKTTSLGGQANWDGNDLSGNRVSTGVYMIFASDRSGDSKCNTKVLVVR